MRERGESDREFSHRFTRIDTDDGRKIEEAHAQARRRKELHTQVVFPSLAALRLGVRFFRTWAAGETGSSLLAEMAGK